MRNIFIVLVGELVRFSEILNVFGIKKLLIVLMVEIKFSVVVVLVVVLCIVCVLLLFWVFMWFIVSLWKIMEIIWKVEVFFSLVVRNSIINIVKKVIKLLFWLLVGRVRNSSV